MNPRYTSIELDPESEMPKQFMKSNSTASSFGYRGDPIELAKNAASKYEYLLNYLTMVGTKSFRNFECVFLLISIIDSILYLIVDFLFQLEQKNIKDSDTLPDWVTNFNKYYLP